MTDTNVVTLINIQTSRPGTQVSQ